MIGDRMRQCALCALLLAAAWRTPACGAGAAVPRAAASAAKGVQLQDAGADIRLSGGNLSLRLMDGNILHVHFIPAAGATPPTLVMAPGAAGTSSTPVVATRQGADPLLRGGQLRIALDQRSGTLTLYAADART